MPIDFSPRWQQILKALPDVPETEPPREIAITTLSEFRGNRLTHHFYPEHWARVQLARHNARRYGAID